MNIDMTEIEQAMTATIEKTVKGLLDEFLAESMPVKRDDPYCSYESHTGLFYISTTDEEQFDGRISLDEIVYDFVDSHKCMGEDGELISKENALPLINKLRAAADFIECRVDKE